MRGLGGAASKTGKQLQTTGKQGAAAAQKITIGFGGLAKALVAREIVSALNNLKTAILESADAAAEFEIAVARISNIAQGSGSSITALTDQLAEMAVALGRPQTEVTSAAFEALQNDLGSTVETMQLLEGAANNLALVTGGTLTQAINSLSSVLKAYNLNIDQADRITDVFFAAIDKGRITLAELENSLGKITPLAAKLDIDFENVAAAMAAITQQGTSASVANTQLRSIMQKLIRPTKELQQAFDKLGVDTFQELIGQSGNLQVALTAIAKALNNDERAIATAFGRLRGQLGVFNLLANESKIFKDTLDAVSNSAGKAAEGADKIDGTAARESQKAWAEFDETMRQVGDRVLETQTNFIKFFNEVIPSVETAVGVFGSLKNALIVLGGAAVIAAISALRTALLAASAASLGLLAIPAAIGLVAFTILELRDAFSDTEKSLKDFQAETDKVNSRIEKNSIASAKRTTQEIKALLGERGEAVDAYVAGLADAFQKETQVLRDAANRVKTVLDASFEDFGTGFDAIFSRIKSQLQGIDSALASATGKQASALQALADFRFDKEGRGRSAAQNLGREISRAEETSRKLSDALSRAKFDPKAIPEARQLSDLLKKRADSIRQQATLANKNFPSRRGVAAADRFTENSLKARVKLEGDVVKSLKKQKTITESIFNSQEAIKDEIKLKQELQKALISETDAKGQFKTEAQLSSDKKSLVKVENDLRKLFGELDTEFFAKFGEQKNLNALAKALQAGITQAQVDFGSISDQLAAKLAEPVYKVFADVEINRASINKKIDDALFAAAETQGRNAPARNEAVRAKTKELLKAQEDSGKELVASREKIANLDKQSLAAIIQASKIRGAAVKAEEVRRRRLAQSEGGFTPAQIPDRPEGVAEQTAAVQAILNSLLEIRKKLQLPGLEQTDIDAINIQLKALNARAEGIKINLLPETGESTISSLSTAIETIQAQVDENEIKINIDFDPEAISGLNTVLRELGSTGKKALGEVGTAANGANTQIDNIVPTMGRVAASYNPAIAQAKRLEAANKAAAAAARSDGAGGGSKFHGGKLSFRASGGRGPDTLNTMTAPGEFVMNSKSVRKFFPQISAMNAGQSPQFRESGGSVTNIGDINVNVTGGAGSENPGATGRQIASSLARELRRNSSKI